MKYIFNKTKLLQVATLLSLSLLFSCAQPGPVDVTGEIRTANEEFVAAFNANDAARLTAVYTTDASIYPPNSDAISGSEGIEAFWKAGFEAGISSGMLDTVKATAYGDTAVEEGKFEINAADGSLIDKGKYIVIWKKVEGAWKYHQDIWNSSMPLPEPEPETPAAESVAETVE